jgi:uncharacterized protein (TIGR02246 family)
VNPTTLGQTALAVVCDIADQFEHCWNAADGVGFAEPFADDADVITPQGVRLLGRREISLRSAEVLARTCGDDSIGLRVVDVRCTSATTFVALIEQHWRRRSDPVAERRTSALATVVVAESACGWEVTTLHCTSRAGAQDGP